jgi:hypothetical protein
MIDTQRIVGFEEGCKSMTAKPEHYRVVRDYESPYPNSMSFLKGELVEVGQEFKDDPDWENWVWCEGNNKKAWVPKQYIKILGANGIFERDYDALELSVQVGEKLVIHEIVNGFGLSEKPDGAKGWVPMRNLVIEKE